jgi:hypothetical protein
MARSSLAALVICVALGGPAAADDAAAPRKPVRVQRGAWLSVKGGFLRDGTLLADDIGPAEEEKASAKGTLGPVDAAARTVRFGPMVLDVRETTRLEDDSGAPLRIEDLAEGDRVKLSLSQQPDGEVRLQRLRRLEPGGTSQRIEGPIERISPPSARSLSLRILGVVVECAGADWAGVEAPRVLRDDDDWRPVGAGFDLGQGFRLSGEVRLDVRSEDEMDLTSLVADDVLWRRVRSELELLFPSSRRFAGMAEVLITDEEAFADESRREDDRTQVKPGETYVLISNLGRHVSLQIGRSTYDDERDWIYRRDLDAVRVFADWPRVHLEASASAQLVDPERRQADVRNVLFLGAFALPHEQQVTAWILDRRDTHVDVGGSPPEASARDFSPRFYGVHAGGEPGKRWTWWLDAAHARGDLDGDRLKAWGADGGATFRFKGRLEPTLTWGHAWGSGDPSPGHGDEESFRQTGLHGNNGKWNGVTNFRYYGELLRPELSNLHVTTLGFGIKPRERTSIDLAWHSYTLDERLSPLRSAIQGRGMDLVHDNVGTEWDLVVGIEEWKHLELELDVGWFSPGSAWRGPTEDALFLGLKTKYVF